MKYMLLIYNNPATYESWSEAERAALFGDVDVIMKELTASGELVGGEALADSSHTKTVRVRDGVPAATDGPFAEAKEQLAGYLTVDCATPSVRSRSPPAGPTPSTSRWRFGRCSTSTPAIRDQAAAAYRGRARRGVVGPGRGASPVRRKDHAHDAGQ